MSIDELKQFKGQDGFSIPSDELLYLLSQNKPSTTGDIGKQAGDNARGVGNWNATSDYTRVGQDKRVEVIRYWSRNAASGYSTASWSCSIGPTTTASCHF
jgi:hypothetical protein